MAGDWIKMRVGLTTNPRVLRIAECLLEDRDFLDWSGLSYGVGTYPAPTEKQDRSERHAALRVTRYVTVTALLRFWGYANEHAKGEFIAGVFPEDVDEITGVPGFAGAIKAAGWVNFDPAGGLSMPNFHEHNTSADARSSGAERQARYREKHKQAGPGSDVTRDVTVTHREEKSREEKKQKKKPHPDGVLFEDWLADCAAKGEPAIPADHAAYAYAEKIGMPSHYIALAWSWLKSSKAGKRSGNWRNYFLQAVKGNWPKYWFQADDGSWQLTTAGKQAMREQAP